MWILFDLGSIAFLAALLLTPWVRDFSVRRGLVDTPDAVRKIHRRPVPRMGGVAVIAAYAIALAFIFIAPYRNLQIDLPTAVHGALTLLPPAILIFLTGLIDDLVNLRPWQKLLAEIGAAVWVYFNGIRVSVLKGTEAELWLSLPVTVLWLVGCTNALNLIDGMDGLASGVGFFAASTTLVAALTHEHVELALVTAPMVGALLGFLRYNFNPASIFLGDCGSLTVGFLLGCYGALWSHKSAAILGLTAPLMALAIPLLDVALSVLRRFLRGRPLFSPDRGHIHHRLIDHGLTPRRAVLLLYSLCGLAAIFSLLQDLGNQRFGGLIVVLFCAAAWMGIQHLGYAELGIAGRLFFGGSLRQLIDIQARLQQFQSALQSAKTWADRWSVILQGCSEFGFRGARMKIGDAIYERMDPASPNAVVWQLRIPLPHGQYVNFYREIESAMHPITLSNFAEIVQKALTAWLATPEPQFVPETASGPSPARSSPSSANAGAISPSSEV
jgi:UDP-GlcNAc:undecaprenyl-phosphate GlcNAc-1-phosphate transferase